MELAGALFTVGLPDAVRPAPEGARAAPRKLVVEENPDLARPQGSSTSEATGCSASWRRSGDAGVTLPKGRSAATAELVLAVGRRTNHDVGQRGRGDGVGIPQPSPVPYRVLASTGMAVAGEETDWLVTTLASDATDGEGVLPGWIRPLSPDFHVVGRASTATVSRDDSLHFRLAAERGPDVGTVLVVGGGTTSRRACMGGLVAKDLVLKGFEAAICDGLVRDAREIRASGLKVWSRGVCPIASKKDGGGQTGGSVLIGDVLVRDGDLVIADEDGIVVWPEDRYEELLGAARARLASDQRRERALDEELAGRSPRA